VGLVAGEVLEVQDGDTFLFMTAEGEVTIRLLGVNAPERDECLHDEAAPALANLLANADVGVDEHGQDQFGRTLAYVWTGDILVNLELVENGLAIATTPGETETWGADLLAAEEAAFRGETGLWAANACDPDPVTSVDLEVDTSGHNPSGPDDQVLDFEQVAIVNRGTAMADLSGWVLRDESSSHRFRFPDGTLIEPGSALEVSSDDPGWDPGGSPVWNNDGDMALVLTPSGTVVARERYRP
jgi:endonuclease YncB( thermonuclease family)